MPFDTGTHVSSAGAVSVGSLWRGSSDAVGFTDRGGISG